MDKGNEYADYNADERKVPSGHQAFRMHLPTLCCEPILVVQAPGSTVLPGQSLIFP